MAYDPKSMRDWYQRELTNISRYEAYGSTHITLSVKAYRELLQVAIGVINGDLQRRERAKIKRLFLAAQGRELRLVSDQTEHGKMDGVQGGPEPTPPKPSA